MAHAPTLEELYEALEAAPHSTKYQPDRGAYVLYHYYVLGYSLERIAARMFVSKATVQQTRRNAEQKLTVATLQRLKGVREVAHTPWRAALDAKLRLISYFKTDEFMQTHAAVGLADSDYIRTMYTYYRGLATIAEPIWVSTPVGNGIVNNVCDENTVFDMANLSIPRDGLVWFDQPLVHTALSPKGDKVATIVRGIMYGIETDDNGARFMMVVAWHQDIGGIGLFPSLINLVPDGQSIDEWIVQKAISIEDGKLPDQEATLKRLGFTHGDLENMDALEGTRTMYGFELRYLYTLLSFMNQRIVTSAPTPVDRNAKRQAERQAIHPEVRVITWRLKKYQRMETEGRQVDWSCHWPSRAHDRHLADGRVIPIPGCIKGPRDKPFKPATPLVHQVTRT